MNDERSRIASRQVNGHRVLGSSGPASMSPAGAGGPRFGYVVKRYPRYSETFIVGEILAHEAAGAEVEIFSLMPPSDTHFQDCISRVRAPVRYLNPDSIKIADFWSKMQASVLAMPDGWSALEFARGEEARELQQAMLLTIWIRQQRLTHLHAHFATSATTVARLAARFAGIPFTMTAHAKDIFHESVDRDDFRRKLTDAAATITVSDYNVRYLIETYGPRAADRLVRIYNGMNLAGLPYSPPIEREPLIVGVGRLVEKKGFDDLVRACDLLKRQGEPFRCVIAGTGELEVPLCALISDLKVGDHVQLLGPRPQRDVFALLNQAAAFAAPCIVGGDGNRDGLPTVLLEAMALGTPCVSTDVTGIPEAIRHDRTGLVVRQRNPGELAGALRKLLREPQTRLRLALGARQLIEDEFDIARNTSRLRGVFAECAGSNPSSAPAPAVPGLTCPGLGQTHSPQHHAPAEAMA